ncbi:hypothetical protein B0919_08050 [Hymenobacter sp. CRA2]|nr:hypothetical protein B0919_08050 [Hymenobacter sp. CRA2]
MLLAGAVVFGAFAKLSGGASLAFFGLQILLQALANATLGLLDSFGQTQGKAAGYWLSALLVLLIGPGSCALVGVTLY